MKNICFELTTATAPIRLVQTGKNVFYVEYGLQRDRGTYAEAASLLGQAIMHAAACDGKLVNS